MRDLIQQLASVSRGQLQRMHPKELAALIRECERILMLAQGGAADLPAQRRVDHVEPEDWPDFLKRSTPHNQGFANTQVAVGDQT